MMKYVVCGTSVEDVEAGVKAMKMAITSGATCGVGGSTMAEVEKNLDAMKQMVGGISTPKACSCPCPRSISGRELLNMIENAKTCPEIVNGDVAIYDCEDEDEEIDCSEGYMAMTECGEQISYLCDTPEEAMETALAEGYLLDEIYVNEVRFYDGDTVEVISTVYRPTN